MGAHGKNAARERAKAKLRRCALYTRKSPEEGLEQDFNSLHAQREACEAFVRSQAGAGWRLIQTAYDDGGFSGGTLERPALQRLLADIRERLVDIIVVYKVDLLTRSLADFAKMVELFDAHGISFVAVTQQFNATTSMGRLTVAAYWPWPSSSAADMASKPALRRRWWCGTSRVGSRRGR